MSTMAVGESECRVGGSIGCSIKTGIGCLLAEPFTVIDLNAIQQC